MAELFPDIATDFTDATLSAGNHATRHNAVAAAVNLLKDRTDRSFGRIYNVESQFDAVPDVYFRDGVANSTTTFTSASAGFTGADVGKTFVAWRAGDSSWQPLHTTISSVTNSTTVVLANAAGRSTTGVRFYISRNGDQTASLLGAIDQASTDGGGIVFAPGVGYAHSGLIMKERVALWGAGKHATYFHLLANSNVPSIMGDLTTDNSATLWSVRHMHIDGNRKRQSNLTAQVNTTYVAGSSTMVLKNVTNPEKWPAVGMISVGSNSATGARYTYFDMVNNGNGTYTLQSVLGDYEYTTDVGAAVDTVVTNFTSPGIHIAQRPASLDIQNPALADYQEPTVTLDDLWVQNNKGDGVQAFGMSDARWNDLLVTYNEQSGVRPSWDTYLTNINSGNNERYGFMVRGAQAKLLGMQAYYNGLGGTHPHVAGFLFEGPTSLEAGGKMFNICSQDNKGDGVVFRNSQRPMGDIYVDSNGWLDLTGVTYVGVRFVGASNGNVRILSTDRFINGSPSTVQKYGISVETGATKTQNMSIFLTHKGAGGSAGLVLEPIKPGSDLSGGNLITVNSQGGYKIVNQAVTGVASTDILTSVGHGQVANTAIYFNSLTGGSGLAVGTQYFIINPTANTFQVSLSSGGAAVNFTTDLTAGQWHPATYNPDPYDAEVHELTAGGPVTFGTPPNGHLGVPLRLRHIQDSVGNRAITFSGGLAGIFWGPSFAAGAENVVAIEYNGSAWKQLIPDPSAAVSKRVLADVTNSTTTVAALTDLDQAVAANSDYTFEYDLMYSSAALTTGLGLQVGVSGSTPVSIAYDVQIMGFGNADGGKSATLGLSQNVFHGLGTAIDDLVMSTDVAAINTVYPARVRGSVRTGATGGTLSIKQRSEIATSAITIKRGSGAVIQAN